MSIFFIEVLLISIVAVFTILSFSFNSRIKMLEQDIMHVNNIARTNTIALDTLEVQVLSNNELIKQSKRKPGRPRKNTPKVIKVANGV